MDIIEECEYKYRQIFSLMEQDAEEIALGMQGELLDAYRDLVKQEEFMLEKAYAYILNKC